MKEVSVALATYNGAFFLTEQLQSLVDQTHLPTQVILCDDGSTDDTLQIATRFSTELPLRIIRNGKSLGVVENFKKAVSLCTGEYIALCDQDDVWYPDKLEQSVAMLASIDGDVPALIYSDLEVVDKELNTVASSFWQLTARKPSDIDFVKLLLGNVVTGCTVMMNQTMAIEMQRMPEGVEMHDFWLALIAYGIGHCAYIDKPTIKYRQHGSNVTSTEQINIQTKLSQTGRFLLDSAYASTYKLDAIRQGERFFDLYGDRLSIYNRKALENIIALKAKHPLLRKMYVMNIKYLSKRWRNDIYPKN